VCYAPMSIYKHAVRRNTEVETYQQLRMQRILYLEKTTVFLYHIRYNYLKMLNSMSKNHLYNMNIFAKATYDEDVSKNS